MLYEYRTSHQLTQQQMADMLGVSVCSYCLYENHKREMTFDTLIKFLKIRCDVDDEKVIKVIDSFRKWFN